MKEFIRMNERWVQAVFEWLCIGIVISLVFYPIGVSILGIALFGCWLFVISVQKFTTGTNSKLVFLFCSMYILVIIGIFYSHNLETALFKAQQKSALAMFPIVFGLSNVLQTDSIRRVKFSLVISMLVGCLYCLVRGVFHFSQTRETAYLNGHPLVMLKDMNPYLMGFLCLMSIVFCCEALLKTVERNSVRKWILAFSIILLSVFIVLIGNRTLIFCWFITSCFYFFKVSKSVWLRVLVPIVSVLLLILAIFFVPALNRQMKDLTDGSSNNNIPLDQDGSLGRSWGGKAIRMAIWRCSMDIIKEKPVFGVGSGDAQDALQEAYEKRKFYFASRYNRYNAHNQYIQELVNLGLLGLLAWLSCLIGPILFFRSTIDREYLIFLLCIVAISCTESMLELSKGVVVYSFFNSFFAFNLNKPQVS